MTTRIPYVIMMAAILTLVPVLGASAGIPIRENVQEVTYIFDDAGNLIWEIGLEPTNPELTVTKHYLHHESAAAKGGKPGGGGGGGNDCTSTAFRPTGWFWDQPYSAKASSHASQFSTAGNTWDSETGGNIFGGVTSGNSGTAGVYDGVNQIDFVSLGASSTIAVTTTWSYTQSGLAVESDGQYNTYYSWSTNGASGSMDVLNIAVHELGHTFGLDHPKGRSISCLSMYAYAGEGETQKRTLGVGDILGIEDIYGA